MVKKQSYRKSSTRPGNS